MIFLAIFSLFSRCLTCFVYFSSVESFEWKKITPLSSITPTQRSSHATITLSPYSVHSGPISYSRPLTAKSAPDRTGLSNNHHSFQHFHRTASADSILDFCDKPLIKGKSLDLTYELDNLAYDKSFPDITVDAKLERPGEEFETDSARVIQVQPSSETSLQNMEHVPQFIQKNWAIVVVAGKGKLCTDLYQTSVDIWRCDIGPGINYIIVFSLYNCLILIGQFGCSSRLGVISVLLLPIVVPVLHSRRVFLLRVFLIYLW